MEYVYKFIRKCRFLNDANAGCRFRYFFFFFFYFLILFYFSFFSYCYMANVSFNFLKYFLKYSKDTKVIADAGTVLTKLVVKPE